MKHHSSSNKCRLNCSKVINSGQLTHSGQHKCIQEAQEQHHYCTNRCPECNAICIKKVGHKDKHLTQQHRNKESQCFTKQKGLQQIIEIDQIKKYNVGDLAKIENCYQSCERRGRSHYHLVECKGGDNCLEKQNNYKGQARHSIKQYNGFEKITFDEVLCSAFWVLNNWEHPIKNSMKLNLINGCNFYCILCSDQDKSFCMEKAWHSQSQQFNKHQFPCEQHHQEKDFFGISICFVIDATASMQSYLDNAINIIKTIVDKTKEFKMYETKKLKLNFSVVSYKDHRLDEGWFHKKYCIVDSQDFTDDKKCIAFLNKIKAEGGDDYPEALLDGLNAATKLSWANDCYKVLYLITDAPPHGNHSNNGSRAYHNFSDNYPNGCPCGLTQTPILEKIKKMNIKFKILRLNNRIDLMIHEFKKDYNKLQVFDVDNIQKYVSIIVEDVCQVLQFDEVTYEAKYYKK